MNDLQVFGFEGRDVRTVTINGKVYFVGKDIAEVLGYSNPTKALQDHCQGPIETRTNDSLGRLSKIIVIPEGDVYRLIARSRLPEAQRIESWIFDEVVPSVVKTGSYAVALPDFTNPVIAARAWADEVEAKMQAEQKLIEAQPKINAHDALVSNGNSMSITDAAKHFNLPPKRVVFPYLRENGYLTLKDLPTQKAIDADIMVLREAVVDGEHIYPQAKVLTCQLVRWNEYLIPKIDRWYNGDARI